MLVRRPIKDASGPVNSAGRLAELMTDKLVYCGIFLGASQRQLLHFETHGMGTCHAQRFISA